MNKLRDKASPEADKHILVGRKAHEADISIYTLYIIYYILYIIYYILYIIKGSLVANFRYTNFWVA